MPACSRFFWSMRRENRVQRERDVPETAATDAIEDTRVVPAVIDERDDGLQYDPDDGSEERARTHTTALLTSARGLSCPVGAVTTGDCATDTCAPSSVASMAVHAGSPSSRPSSPARASRLGSDGPSRQPSRVHASHRSFRRPEFVGSIAPSCGSGGVGSLRDANASRRARQRRPALDGTASLPLADARLDGPLDWPTLITTELATPAVTGLEWLMAFKLVFDVNDQINATSHPRNDQPRKSATTVGTRF